MRIEYEFLTVIAVRSIVSTLRDKFCLKFLLLILIFTTNVRRFFSFCSEAKKLPSS